MADVLFPQLLPWSPHPSPLLSLEPITLFFKNKLEVYFLVFFGFLFLNFATLNLMLTAERKTESPVLGVREGEGVGHTV